MYWYRITKYNPKFRGQSGAYQKDEWTSFSDIGRSFNGQIFSFENYLQIEDAYLAAVNFFLKISGVHSLTIKDLEKNSPPDKNGICSVEAAEVFSKIRNNENIDKKTILNIVQLCLRENIWCKLESKAMFIHFGYDYYMYLGIKNKLDNISAEKIRELGLFVEQLKSSPYLQK